MKLVTYLANSTERTGVIVGDRIMDLKRAHAAASALTLQCSSMPSEMNTFLRYGEGALSDVRQLISWFTTVSGEAQQGLSVPIEGTTLCAPVPHPTSMRDGYAFRQHVEAARRNRGVEMIPEFDEIPIFYFTNHQAVFGPGDVHVQPLHCDKLDFELECAIVIGKQGRNIKASEADSYVAGLMVMNDWSARTLQMKEMMLNLGPAKGKDFATSIGPWLVTLDELADVTTSTPQGNQYDLAMSTVINGIHVSAGNVKDMSWTFAQIIERASYGVTLYPGDVIGSGTCGTGCFLELNGSKVYDPAWWLKPGDAVTCAVDRLGVLTNTVVLDS
ncbi:MAG: fumarylacetoacetate hydrolase family protein [Candidatus Kapabacteria bacterium]|nr:fumarylacetoacetate hydrolase family protein [Candidatus Kapabacteria bacterium]